MIVLRRDTIGGPQAWLDQIEAQGRAFFDRLMKCRVVMDPQITLKPNNAVAHGSWGGCRDFGWLRQFGLSVAWPSMLTRFGK